MAKTVEVSSGWRTYEVCERAVEGECVSAPFSKALASSGTMPTPAIRKMQTLEYIGLAQAERHFKDGQGQRLLVRKDDVVWLLKCKPSCWRLYFYVYENGKDKRFIYIRAVCKKQTEEDPKDAQKARRIADRIRSGRSCVKLFEFPSV